MAFGPAVLPSVQVGQRVAMVLVAKDSTGKARTSGDDAIQVAVTSPSGSTEEVVATVHDYANGRYEISYVPIAAGDYSVAVTLDENAFDADDNYMHIRGSPFQVRVRARVTLTLTLTQNPNHFV